MKYMRSYDLVALHVYFSHSSFEGLWIISYFNILVHLVKCQVSGMKGCISTARKRETYQHRRTWFLLKKDCTDKYERNIKIFHKTSFRGVLEVLRCYHNALLLSHLLRKLFHSYVILLNANEISQDKYCKIQILFLKK